MPRVEVDIPDNVEVELDRLVDEGEFVSRQEAAEEILAHGLQVYKPEIEANREEEEMFGEEMLETSERSLGGDEDDYEF
ncbi:cell surface protein [Salarchaeum sp. JOR-1]|uniref:DUF7120 family protein n=1 Tax=Salarchaeum sp. JOR-1 TaxID=2599399 RepID=UPI001198A469|nr:cell surface protein [Salarchaeum sp. JOR-1]QDX40932.1 cell surface protein [Salarchaeum sp. JOR-1]